MTDIATGNASSDFGAQAEFDMRIYEARLEGYSVRSICRQLGLDEFEVQNAIMRAQDRISPNTREQLIDLDAARLDRYAVAIDPQAKAGDFEAIKVMLAIMERRAKLFGLDAPSKSDLLVRREAEFNSEPTGTDKMVVALQKIADMRAAETAAEAKVDAILEEASSDDDK